MVSIETRKGSRASWVSLKLYPKDVMPMGHIDFPSSTHQIACDRSISTKVDVETDLDLIFFAYCMGSY